MCIRDRCNVLSHYVQKVVGLLLIKNSLVFTVFHINLNFYTALHISDTHLVGQPTLIRSSNDFYDRTWPEWLVNWVTLRLASVTSHPPACTLIR